MTLICNTSQSTPVKRQTLTLAAKILVLIAGPTVRPEPISSSPISTLQLLTRHIFNLARYDTSYDVRDRARILVSLLTGVAPWLSQSQTNGFEMIGEDAVSNGGRGGVVLRREQVKLVLFEGKVVAAGHKVPTSACTCPSCIPLWSILDRVHNSSFCSSNTFSWRHPLSAHGYRHSHVPPPP